MNKDNEHHSTTDTEVAAAYRAIASETAPNRLDDIVLGQAAAEARPRTGTAAYFYSIRRPLAFAATLVLALSIVLQFDSLMTNTRPEATIGPNGGTISAGEIAALIDASAQKFHEQTQQDERIIAQSLLNNPIPETAGNTATDARRYCDSGKIAAAETWWACITDLEQTRRYEAAAYEYRLLTNTYPDFLPAE